MNKDAKKIIEEMEIVIGEALGLTYEGESLPFSLHTRNYLAKKLVNAGYRKLGDDEIIIVPSEYDTITMFYERWKEADRKLYNARQDIANEIVKDLLPLCDYYPVYVLVNRLCKKFGLSMEGLDE